MKLGKYSFGTGDRFGHQGEAQLAAILKAKDEGVNITPVWNKSFREHQIIGSKPTDTRREADEAVRNCGWQESYFVDADHVSLKNVDHFIEASNFFTLDVADFIGRSADDSHIKKFVAKHEDYLGEFGIPAITEPFMVTREIIEEIARKYLFGIEEAGRIYRHILAQKERASFVVEVSMDETEDPQTPLDLFFILSGLAGENIPAQTIAPKFSGRFNKGVDYVGDVGKFQMEFEQDVAVVAFAIKEFQMEAGLKLSVHSGSDKFSIYRAIKETIKKFNAGLHIKTAGTTWLEEIIGLAEAGGEGLDLAKEIYRQAYSRFDELCQPYASVIDINPQKLPPPDEIIKWPGEKYVASLRHNPTDPNYNLHVRQLLHVAYKIAAEMGNRYAHLLKKYKSEIAKNVTENLFERHIKAIFFS